MKEKILYIFFALFFFFINMNFVSADDCSNQQEKIESYNIYKKLLTTIDCTDDSNSQNVSACNETNIKKNIVVTELMKLNEEGKICKNLQKDVDKIIEENEDNCGKIFDDSFTSFVNGIMVIFYILGPILLILFGSLDFAKATVSAEQDALRKAGKNFAKRVAATLLLFAAPTIVNFVISLNISDKYLSGNAYTCNYKYMVFNKKYKITYVPINNSSTNKKNTIGSSGTKSGNYIIYAQCDSSWGSDRLINSQSGNTLCNAGCAVTAVSMQMVNSGAVSPNAFSPRVLNNSLQKNTNSGGNITWSATTYASNNKFILDKSVYMSGNITSKARELSTYLLQGYYPVIQVKHGTSGSSHYVAVFQVNGENIVVGDPAGGVMVTLNDTTYPIVTESISTQTLLYKVVN